MCVPFLVCSCRRSIISGAEVRTMLLPPVMYVLASGRLSFVQSFGRLHVGGLFLRFSVFNNHSCWIFSTEASRIRQNSTYHQKRITKTRGYAGVQVDTISSPRRKGCPYSACVLIQQAPAINNTTRHLDVEALFLICRHH